MLLVPSLALESPALCRTASKAPAFEVKFLLGENDAREVEHRLRPRLALDAHAAAEPDHAYRITSVYFDTPHFDVYHRAGGQRSRKYRVRRYGAAPIVYLERKTKRGQQVWKRRTATSLNDLAGVGAENGPGRWFAQQLARRALRPVCRITYQRVAYMGMGASGPIRLTFDRSAFGLPAAGTHVEPFADGASLLRDEVCVEFKFLGAMPGLFKEVIESMRLTPRPASKYRRCVESAGLLPSRSAPDA